MEPGFQDWLDRSMREKLAAAVSGLRALGNETWTSASAWRRLLVVVVAPVACLYVVLVVLRDTVVYRRAVKPARRHHGLSDYLGHRFGGTQRLVHHRERRLVAALLERVGSLGTVLDVPAGYGRFADALGAVAGTQMVCADIDRERLRALRTDARAATPPALVRVDLRRGLPFKTATFDLVFNLRDLHHVHAPRARSATLVELARVSRRFVIVSYYRRASLHGLVRAIQQRTRGDRRRGPAMVDTQDFAWQLRRAGYRVVCERGLIPWVHAQHLVLLEKVERTSTRPRVFRRPERVRAVVARGVRVAGPHER